VSIERTSHPDFAITADHWLGERLGKPTWRVVAATQGTEPLESLASRGKLFAYAKVPVTALTSVQALVAEGFFPVDVAVAFEGPAVGGTAAEACRYARADDRDAVTRIAGQTFEFSRFHLDPKIPREIADRLKAQWTASFFSGGRGDAMAVATVAGEVVAFLQLFYLPGDTLLIDLIGVARGFQGRGIARELIRFACTQPAPGRAAPGRVKVGTQIANTRSVRLYESLGLRLTDAQYVLHLHRE
jgi:ribosomal protein S18 acetylase RimI-like enzyme